MSVSTKRSRVREYYKGYYQKNREAIEERRRNQSSREREAARARDRRCYAKHHSIRIRAQASYRVRIRAEQKLPNLIFLATRRLQPICHQYSLPAIESGTYAWSSKGVSHSVTCSQFAVWTIKADGLVGFSRETLDVTVFPECETNITLSVKIDKNREGLGIFSLVSLFDVLLLQLSESYRS